MKIGEESAAHASKDFSTIHKIVAWSVHFFTMTGLLWAILAINALYTENIKEMWIWLVISLVVDAADGPMARKARVKDVLPHFSGAMVDNIVDYITWTLIPAMFIMQCLPLGPGYLPFIAGAFILVSSMFCYANTLMKSNDWYFVGFPATWNVIAVIMWLFSVPMWLNWIVIVVFSALAVIPWKWVHPFRVKKFRAVTATFAIIWTGTTAWLIAVYPENPAWLVILWLISGLWIVFVGLLRTFFPVFMSTQHSTHE
ncbi:CDP-alcohol phosphatidyltransferase family protein [Actinotignum urinale]|uniref:CDP-alcohol phosphatidyltransferase family protein n=1 Tax=Actinotignum urinale TaxID=190146 RepID=UPI0003B68DCB|nr:phosphatidylcholine synthase [Actinotignum urinale]MDY5159713.1 phosphatidylcholine synthase [Actinotignum urinale]